MIRTARALPARRRSACYATIALLLLCSVSSSAFELSELKPLDGYTDVYVASLSRDGAVAAGYSTRKIGNQTDYEATVWGTNRLPVNPGFGPHSEIRVISADGRVVAGYTTSGPCRMALGGSLESLPLAPTAEIKGISHDGSIIAGTTMNSLSGRAFVYSDADGITIIPSSYYMVVQALSADGSTVVGWDTNSYNGNAFTWRKDTGVTLLPKLPGGDWTQAYAVSGNGSVVVGEAHFRANPNGGHPYGIQAAYWTSDGAVRALGENQLTRMTYYSAFAISEDGRRILGVGPDDSWVWDEGTGFQPVESFLAAHGVDTTLIKGIGTKISGDGNAFITGIGPSRTFILIVPEPSSLHGLIAGIGGFGWLMLRRRK